MHDKRPVLHVMEWLAGLLDGEDRRQSFRKKVNETRGEVRVVDLTGTAPVAGAAVEEKQEDSDA